MQFLFLLMNVFVSALPVIPTDITSVAAKQTAELQVAMDRFHQNLAKIGTSSFSSDAHLVGLRKMSLLTLRRDGEYKKHINLYKEKGDHQAAEGLQAKLNDAQTAEEKLMKDTSEKFIQNKSPKDQDAVLEIHLESLMNTFDQNLAKLGTDSFDKDLHYANLGQIEESIMKRDKELLSRISIAKYKDDFEAAKALESQRAKLLADYWKLLKKLQDFSIHKGLKYELGVAMTAKLHTLMNEVERNMLKIGTKSFADKLHDDNMFKIETLMGERVEIFQYHINLAKMNGDLQTALMLSKTLEANIAGYSEFSQKINRLFTELKTNKA